MRVYVALVRDALGISVLGVFTDKAIAHSVADSYARGVLPNESLQTVLEFALDENRTIATFPNWRTVPDEDATS